MAAAPTSAVSRLSLSTTLLFFLFFACPAPTCYCSPHGGDGVRSYRDVDVHTLLPPDACSPPKGFNHTELVQLKVVHRHGPCSSPTHGEPRKRRNPNPVRDLLLDESRAESIRSRRRRPEAEVLRSRRSGRGPRGSLAATIPARGGRALGTGNYVVTVGFGSPRADLSLVFDTGSDLTWIQCKPCVAYCYQQQEPVFDPSASSSYQNITCGSADCAAVQSATGNAPGCSAANCLYAIQYGDDSYSIGFYARETLSLTAGDVLPGFRFGCGEKNRGLYGQAAGLLGLGRDAVSVVSQAAGKYGKVFSYCLPAAASSTGYLTMGAGQSAAGASSGVQFTPMLSDSTMQSFYFLDMVGISVGGRQIPVPARVYRSAGTLIDSGTVITRLPPAAYAALRSAFRGLMSSYPAAPALSILDTCYDLSSYGTVSVPKVALLFSGGVVLDVDVSGILFVAKVSQACLAFAGNASPSDVAIIGNTQQKTYKVVYDGSRQLIGFGAGGCS